MASERKFDACDTGIFLRYYRSWVQVSRIIRRHIHVFHRASWSAAITIYVQTLLQVYNTYYWYDVVDGMA